MLNVSEQLKDKIRTEYKCEPEECDVHSALDLAIDLGLLTEKEAATELGFATVAEWMGVPCGY